MDIVQKRKVVIDFLKRIKKGRGIIMIETRTVVICDWCGKEIHGKEKEL